MDRPDYRIVLQADHIKRLVRKVRTNEKNIRNNRSNRLFTL